tara:strand:+ start:564 stop:953 length:390 start_codon:yes stop_codon:yes gene_type:complete
MKIKLKKKKTPYQLDVIGKRKLVPLEIKYAIRNVDQLNKASDYKNKSVKKNVLEEYKRRLLLQTRKHKKSKKLFQKIHKTRKNPIKILNKLSVKQIEDTYYTLLKNHKTKRTRRKRKKKYKKRSKSTKK